MSAAFASANDDERVYRDRFEAVMRDKGVVTDYAPMEAVPGATTEVALPVATRPTVRAEALARATDYAAANRSSALLVWREGRLEAESYFNGTTALTPLVSKSLSKPLGAIAVGRAIELGKIRSLDQPVADFIPEWRDTPKAKILVRHLLDMRSGLLEQGYSTDPDSPWNRAYLSPVHDRYLIDAYPLTDPPGTRYAYSNATGDLVALLIERATNRRYADFVGQEILAPIGAPGGDIWVDREGGLAHSGCCMHLPAQSWLRLGILLLDDGVIHGRRLLPAGYVDAMATATPQNPHYGLGVWIAGPYVERRGFSGNASGPQVLHGEPYLDRDLILFDGNADQVVYISRATRMVILRMGDQPPKSPEWDNAVLPNLLMRGIIAGTGSLPAQR